MIVVGPFCCTYVSPASAIDWSVRSPTDTLVMISPAPGRAFRYFASSANMPTAFTPCAFRYESKELLSAPLVGSEVAWVSGN